MISPGCIVICRSLVHKQSLRKLLEIKSNGRLLVDLPEPFIARRERLIFVRVCDRPIGMFAICPAFCSVRNIQFDLTVCCRSIK